MKTSFNILIAGVGGQGNLVCGRVLAEAAILEDRRPVLGDTFGASRRGGSVLTHLRVADEDMGPLIPKGHADLVVGMEPVEGLRSTLNYASPGTKVVVSTMPVYSPATRSGQYQYPEVSRITSALRDLCEVVYAVDPKPTLDRIGTYKVLNVFILGVLSGSGVVPFSREAIQSSIEKTVGLETSNQLAFTSGIEEGMRLRSL
ncbi:MAG: 2-oxoacid:acceptor oxidoreductase family protein [Candidatus Thorarchaeota archaeon]